MKMGDFHFEHINRYCQLCVSADIQFTGRILILQIVPTSFLTSIEFLEFEQFHQILCCAYMCLAPNERRSWWVLPKLGDISTECSYFTPSCRPYLASSFSLDDTLIQLHISVTSPEVKQIGYRYNRLASDRTDLLL